MNNSIYLAGPDVFLKNPQEVFAKKKEICAKYGFVGHAPLDNNVNPDAHDTIYDFAMDIYYKNTHMMDICDITVANMTPYHGVSMDVGTAYEMGYMRAQNKLIYGYSNDPTPFIDRQRAMFDHYEDVDDNVYRDSTTHMKFENMGMCDNLMMAGATQEITGYPPLLPDSKDDETLYTRVDVFERAVKALREKLDS